MSVNTVPAARSTRGQKAAGLTMIGVAIAILVGLAAPHVIYPVFLMKALCFALFASGFNLLLGYVGLLSFGHAAYFGLGAYGTALAATGFGLAMGPAAAAGVALAGAGAVVFGWFCVRLSGVYLAMLTLAFSFAAIILVPIGVPAVFLYYMKQAKDALGGVALPSKDTFKGAVLGRVEELMEEIKEKIRAFKS